MSTPVSGPHGLVQLFSTAGVESPVLIHSLTGFLDAGSAGRLAVAHLQDVLAFETIAEFDIDTIYDYRARRPRMSFLTDHYGDIEMPTLRVDRMVDSAGAAFLLLHGPEPDFRWRAFTEDAVWLARRVEASLVLGIHAVPWPAPHTRPVNITAHGNDPALIGDRRAFVGNIEVPAHMAGLLEVAMDDAGIPAMGFAAHVPHYLAAAEHPRASVALLEAVSAQTGLMLPLDSLRARADEADLDIAQQVAGESEHLEAVQMLEVQYDEFMAQLGQQPVEPDSGLPDPEDFVDMVERFLADQPNPDDPA